MRKACDTTGTATASGYAESAYTLAVARETARILRRHGAEVVLTREDDAGVGPCITRRARIGNRERGGRRGLDPRRRRPDGRARLPRHPPDPDRGPDRRHLRRVPAARPRAARRVRGADRPAARDLPGGNGLVARGDLGGLRLSDVPKVFIETANMRNAADARKLESRRFRKRIARGIAEGVIDFLSP